MQEGLVAVTLPELLGPPQLPLSGTTEPPAAFYQSPPYFSNLLARNSSTLPQGWTEDPARWNGSKQHRTSSALSRILRKPFCSGGICFILHMVSSKRCPWLRLCVCSLKSTFLLEPSLSHFCHWVSDCVCLSPIAQAVI